MDIKEDVKKAEQAPKVMVDASTQTDLYFFALEQKETPEEKMKKLKLEGLQTTISNIEEAFKKINVSITNISNRITDPDTLRLKIVIAEELADYMGYAGAGFETLKFQYAKLSNGVSDLDSSFKQAISICEKYKSRSKAEGIINKVARDKELNSLLEYRAKIGTSFDILISKIKIKIEQNPLADDKTVEKSGGCIIN